jgi:hypothetical protein
MQELYLRPTRIAGARLENDFEVNHQGRSVGRIREATERAGHVARWDWNINPPLPIPPWCFGSATTLESAKRAFKTAWDRFSATLTADDIAHWHHHQDAALERWKR